MKCSSDPIRAAIYARVSSDQQAEAATIASQVEALEERLRRGKLHAARRGSVSALAAAPSGYRYVTKLEGDGPIRHRPGAGAGGPASVHVGGSGAVLDRRGVPAAAPAGHPLARGHGPL